MTSGICFAYSRGDCNRGSLCRFSHEGEPPEGEEDAWKAAGGGQSRGGSCFAFQRGECDRGAACKFSHDSAGEGAFANFSSRIDGGGGSGSGYNKGPCYAWQRGECDRGTTCRFSHGDYGTLLFIIYLQRLFIIDLFRIFLNMICLTLLRP